jgi:hypothetical protein
MVQMALRSALSDDALISALRPVLTGTEPLAPMQPEEFDRLISRLRAWSET